MGDAVLLWWFHGDAWEKLKKTGGWRRMECGFGGSAWLHSLRPPHSATRCARMIPNVPSTGQTL